MDLVEKKRPSKGETGGVRKPERVEATQKRTPCLQPEHPPVSICALDCGHGRAQFFLAFQVRFHATVKGAPKRASRGAIIYRRFRVARVRRTSSKESK
eukprot:2664416-Rhodomonas_salina.5